ncbi:MAG: PAS domain S-box protein [Promethearchaeota archaeon]|nr:MAG: PAS domain S-box protein [Candidatus Lokiarchaeota archaeon]
MSFITILEDHFKDETLANLLELIFSNSLIGIELYDSNENLIELNQKCFEIFGVSHLQAAKAFNPFKDPNVPVELRENLKIGESVRFQTTFSFDVVNKSKSSKKKEKSIIHIEVVIIPLFIEKKKVPSHYLVEIQDISQKKMLEVELSLLDSELKYKIENKAEKLSETEEKYKELVENANCVILRMDKDENILYINEYGEHFFGYTSRELIGKHVIGTLVPKIETSGRDLQKMVKHVFANTKNHEKMINENITKDGRRVWVSWVNTEIKDDKGQIIGVLSLGTDITEQKKAEEELKKIEWLLKSKFSLDDNSLQFYGDLTNLNKNGLILNSVGKDVLQSIAKDYLDLLDTSAAIYEENGDYALGTFTSKWCRILDEASRKLCETDDNLEAIMSGKWLCHESCWTDASKRSIEEGREVDIECNGGLHILAVPIWAEGKIVGSINFGYGDPPTDPKKLKEISRKYEVDLNTLEKLAKNYETRPQYIIDIAKKRLVNASKMIGYMIERKMAEDRYKKAEELYHKAYNRANFYKDLFVHDINNIMAVINSSAEIILHDYEKSQISENTPKLLEMIKQQIMKATKLVRNVNILSELEEGIKNIKPIEIISLLKNSIESIKIFHERRDMEIYFEPKEEKITVSANYLLQDVFDNLLNNAVKYNDKAVVTIDIEIYNKRENGKNFIIIEFIDNGMGIKDERKEIIFKKGYREYKGQRGMGLGLSLVKEVIESYEGEVWVENRIKGDYSKGSKFILKIPHDEKK